MKLIHKHVWDRLKEPDGRLYWGGWAGNYCKCGKKKPQ